MVVHDRQAVLDSATVATTLHYLRDPLPEFRRFHGPVDIDDLVQVDSRDDARIQVADLIAGMGRALGMTALERSVLPTAPLDFIARSSLWADDASWSQLTGSPSVVS